MRRGCLRLVPATAAAALCAFAAFGAGAPAGRAAPAAAPDCAGTQLSGADWLYHIAQGTGVRQPFDGTVPAVACTLGLEYAWAYGQLSVRFWDPLALAPAAGLIALRTRAYQPSHLYYSHVRADYDPPLVTTSLDGVAERGPTALALDWYLSDAASGQDVHFWTDEPFPSPIGQTYGAGTFPLIGPHPVLGAAFCRASGPLADLRVVQSVVTSDQPFGVSWHDFVQRFRVPYRCRLHHVELAFVDNTYTYQPIGHVAIYDAGGASTPPAVFADPLADADFYLSSAVPTWGTHVPFVQDPVLEPGHDYWLYVYSGYGYPIYARLKHGNEPAAFTNNIGGCFARTTPFQPWVDYSTNYTLDFRLIGTLLEPLAVPPLARGGGLHVSVAPNPAPAAALVRWSGAREGARLEVLDPRGRRVASFDAGGAEGTWLWRGVADGGGPLPAGVYFVRATDRGGAAGTARVVLIR